MSSHFPGVYRASVFDVNDPLGKKRVRLLVPQVMGDAVSGWAEPATDSGAATVTSASLLWVVFEGGDINRPVYFPSYAVEFAGSGESTAPKAVRADDIRVNPYPHLARVVCTGGGVVTHLAENFKWTQRFMTMNAGRGPGTATSGYFQISPPPIGTVIPGVMGHAGATVVAEGVPLTGWSTLYYILPLGSAWTSLPANFRLASYTANFDVPPDWIPIATRNADAPSDIKLCNGTTIVANAGLDWPGVGVVTARTNLGLGTAAVVGTGINEGDIPLLSTNGRLPIARIAGNTPTGNRFVRDDGFLVQVGTTVLYNPTVNGVLTNSRVGHWSRIGDTITGLAQFSMSAAPGGSITVSLPTPAAQNSLEVGPMYVVGQAIGLRTQVRYVLGAVYIPSVSPGIMSVMSNGGGAPWGPGNPEAWAAGDTWALPFTYQGA